MEGLDPKEEQHNIRVAVRVRPLNQLEKELKNESIWQTSGPYASWHSVTLCELGVGLLRVQLRD